MTDYRCRLHAQTVDFNEYLDISICLSKPPKDLMRLLEKILAAHRDQQGKVLDPVCSHLGCLVRWNIKEESWDCPCQDYAIARLMKSLQDRGEPLASVNP